MRGARPDGIPGRLFALNVMLFARRVFLTAGIYGLIVIAPQLFLEAKTSRDWCWLFRAAFRS